ncbi:amidohydrolase family protein [Herbidospora galbida]|uniref:Amidohydrolase family protein n=1 Tax=Herbidospora galbida TaxID=2575442 RepID=A0A4U3M9V2_9ACTN|nr:amidohydrolase family protein [Herbidospora galbida]TKK85122.1 amidohydrolase family protein [Herbidospora galbida]
MLIIRARRVFDGRDLTAKRAVVVSGGKVVELLDDAPEHGDVRDLGDVTLLPGLVDTHVHLAFDASPDPVTALDREGLYDRMRAHARQQLAAGVTTVRDLGDRGYLALRLAGEMTDGPEILSAGAPITSVKGHCWFLGGEAEGVEGVRRAVRERAAKGAHAIKVMITGGEMTPGTHSHLNQFSQAEIDAAADEARRHGLPIAGHAHGGPGIAAAVAAGFDSVEHVTFLTADDVAPDPAIMAAMAANGVAASLTVGVTPGVTPPPRIAALIPKLFDSLRLLRSSGVTIVGGSDSGIGPPKPHGILTHGGEMLTVAGMTPVEILRAFTSDAARVCRIENRKGRIAPGFDADLLAVRGDPTTDHTALRETAAVFRNGASL